MPVSAFGSGSASRAASKRPGVRGRVERRHDAQHAFVLGRVGVQLRVREGEARAAQRPAREPAAEGADAGEHAFGQVAAGFRISG
jgi:hypothetical protein